MTESSDRPNILFILTDQCIQTAHLRAHRTAARRHPLGKNSQPIHSVPPENRPQQPWLLTSSFHGPHFPHRVPAAFFDRIEDPDCADRIARLRSELLDWMRKQDDPLRLLAPEQLPPVGSFRPLSEDLTPRAIPPPTPTSS